MLVQDRGSRSTDPHLEDLLIDPLQTSQGSSLGVPLRHEPKLPLELFDPTLDQPELLDEDRVLSFQLRASKRAAPVEPNQPDAGEEPEARETDSCNGDACGAGPERKPAEVVSSLRNQEKRPLVSKHGSSRCAVNGQTPASARFPTY